MLFAFAGIANRAQAYHWSGDKAGAANIMSEVDWSAAAELFKLADSVLKEDWSRAAQLMRSMGKGHGKLGILGYHDWPLFRDFRATPEFLAAFKDVFGVDFTTTQTVTNPVAVPEIEQLVQ